MRDDINPAPSTTCPTCRERERMYRAPSAIDLLRYPPDGDRARWVREGDTRTETAA